MPRIETFQAQLVIQSYHAPCHGRSGSHPFLTRATPTQLLAAHKPHAGELVVGWVTTSESSLLYVIF
ncbi:hypothetical protein VN97_g9622 [Penicillium thymicola]|uniref:Uncharacterized protein n=1 Tax=Penicillium thymicola TaxID=293382 RepID=A0AAI9TB25_PENTH|nr:hypothetical protein VN97_g9622 [Penicillium thymicola]